MKWISSKIYKILLSCTKKLGIPEEVVTGGASGVDSIAHSWARNWRIRTRLFYPDWSIGRSAGPIRNRQMAEYVKGNGLLILIWDGRSRGSANMKKTAEKYGLQIYEYLIDQSGKEKKE